jgi:aldehyde:ferredoxin oxidoreductase
MITKIKTNAGMHCKTTDAIVIELEEHVDPVDQEKLKQAAREIFEALYDNFGVVSMAELKRLFNERVASPPK